MEKIKSKRFIYTPIKNRVTNKIPPGIISIYSFIQNNITTFANLFLLLFLTFIFALIFAMFWTIYIKYPSMVFSNLFSPSFKIGYIVILTIVIFISGVFLKFCIIRYFLPQVSSSHSKYEKITDKIQKYANNYFILAITLMFFFIFTSAFFMEQRYKTDIPFILNFEKNQDAPESINSDIQNINTINCYSMEDLDYFVQNDSIRCNIHIDYNLYHKHNISDIYVSYFDNDGFIDVKSNFRFLEMKNLSAKYFFLIPLKKEGITRYNVQIIIKENETEPIYGEVPYYTNQNIGVLSRIGYLAKIQEQQTQKLPLVLTLFSLIFISVFVGVKNLKDIIEGEKK